MGSLFWGKIKTRLVASFLAVIIVVGVGSILIGRKIIEDSIVAQAQDQVKKHLDTASYIYNQDVALITTSLKHVATSKRMARAIQSRNISYISNVAEYLKQHFGFDLIHVTDATGRILTGSAGIPLNELSCLRHVLENGEICYGSEIIPRNILLTGGKELADNSIVEVISTPHERKVKKGKEVRALAQVAACPVYEGKRLIGVIYGAHILNKKKDLVDRIKKLVFHDEKIDGFELGTATIFLDDVRISTNVRREDGTRTIGTRVSREVYHQVVEKEKLWLDKAFVVNKWYISAYQPIYDVTKRVIGIFYVGVLEEKYLALRRKTMLYFVVLMVLTGIFSIILGNYLIRNIIRPIRDLVDVSEDVAGGNLDTQVEREYDGELGQLTRTFNGMVDAIKERDRKLKENTEQQILQSEKLASLGRLASGVAHEINNPLTGILTYSSLLLEDLEESEYAEDIKVIVNETMRCRNIVRELLDFARETQLQIQKADLNVIITETMTLLKRTYNFQNIQVVEDLEPELPLLNLDINQIKSAVSNLAVNAADAMPSGGRLLLSTRFESTQERIVLNVRDDGTGIPEENLKRIFDPFFTTKATGKGTGLGLAVTYGIIERHGGKISVESELEKGTTFIIELPI